MINKDVQHKAYKDYREETKSRAVNRPTSLRD